MKLTHIVIAIVVILAIASVFVFLSRPTDNAPDSINDTFSQKAKQLYLDSLLVGNGSSHYVYSYEEDRNGYIVKTTIMRNGNRSKVVFAVPLSKRTAYFLENSTIGCIQLKNEEEVCAFAEGPLDVSEYMNELRSLFFNDSEINKTVLDVAYLADKKLLTFKNTLSSKSHELGTCSIANFTFNYTNLPILDAARFNLGPGSPLLFNGYFCINPQTKNAQEKYFSYMFRGNPVYTYVNLLSADFTTAPEIAPPVNLSNRLFATLIEEEKIAGSDFLKCYQQSSEERDRCIYSYSLYNKEPLSCRFAGTKSDQCFLNVAVLKNDSSICALNSLEVYKDDCYVEIVRIQKNVTLCTLIQNQTKGMLCNQIIIGNVTNVSS